VLAQVRDGGDAVVAQVQGVQMEGELLDIQHGGQLVVRGFDGG
jgi:hypothetical protein